MKFAQEQAEPLLGYRIGKRERWPTTWPSPNSGLKLGWSIPELVFEGAAELRTVAKSTLLSNLSDTAMIIRIRQRRMGFKKSTPLNIA